MARGCPSTDPGQLLAEQGIDDARAPDLGFHKHHAGVVRDDLPDDARILPERVLTHAIDYCISKIVRCDGNQLAFIGDVKRIEAEYITRATHRVVDGNFGFTQAHADLGARSNFVQDRGDSASGGIAQAMDVRGEFQHRSNQTVQGGAVAFDHPFKFQVLSLRQDRHSMVADITAQDDAVAGARPVGRDVDWLFYDSDPGGCNEYLVCFSAIDDFGVSRDEFDTSVSGRFA